MFTLSKPIEFSALFISGISSILFSFLLLSSLYTVVLRNLSDTFSAVFMFFNIFTILVLAFNFIAKSEDQQNIIFKSFLDWRNL